MRTFSRLFSVLLSLVICTGSFAQKNPTEAALSDMVESFQKGDFSSVSSHLTDQLKQVLPEEKLKQTWAAVESKFGRFYKILDINVSSGTASVLIEFENAQVSLLCYLDDSQKLYGMYFIKRPQNPKKPYPYESREVTYENPRAGIKISGTLTLPSGKKKVPAVLLITGSGQQDRDETLLGHKPFLILADYLTRKGVAVLRVDDRGIKGSTGNFAQSTSSDFADDVKSGIDFLKSCSEIDQKKIGLIGHSEGGLIAPMVASQSKDVAFIILMAGPGLNGKEITIGQHIAQIKARTTDQKIIDRETTFIRNYTDIILNTKSEKEKSEKLKAEFEKYIGDLSDKEKASIVKPDIYIRQKVQSSMLPWLKYFLAYEPAPALKMIACPVLAINGEKDLQVLCDVNTSAIDSALKTGGNKDYTVKKMPGLNHLFQKCNTGLGEEYAFIEETINNDALEAIGNWVIEKTK
jgi:uncharacterized protein